MNHRAVFTIIALLAACSAFSVERKSTDHDDAPGHTLSERIGPFGQWRFFGELEFARQDKGYQAWATRYQRLTVEEKVRYCIYQLRNETSIEADRVLDYEPFSSEPQRLPSCELIKLGRSAVPQLLDALESRASTGMVYNRFTSDTYLVQDAALIAIETIACRYFVKDYPLSEKDPKDRQKVRDKVVQWWEKHKDSDEIQWAKETLFSERAVEGERRGVAIDSLYLRLGKDSYPLLVKAYQQLPKTDAKADAAWLRPQILQWLLMNPTVAEKPIFARALKDSSFGMKVECAEGLWKLGDRSGLEAVVQDTEDRARTWTRSAFLENYDRQISFLLRCDTPRSREAIYKCLRGRNPYLCLAAVRVCPELRMEKAIRILPELFDNTFVLRDGCEHGTTLSNGGYPTSYRALPAWRICDEAAVTFLKAVPDAPQFDGSTAKTQQRSIEKLKQWWKERGQNLVWNERRGVLEDKTSTK